MKEEELVDVFQIAGRTDNIGIMFSDRISLKVDLSVAHQKFNLRLKALLSSGDVNFAHDVVGIQNHIGREDKRVGGGSLPRYPSL